MVLFAQLFSQKNLSHQQQNAHQIAAHPVHHLPMGLADDNSRSFEVHIGLGGCAMSEVVIRSQPKMVLLAQLFSQKNLPHHHQQQCTPDCCS
jgi:hypothetical protein